MPAVCVLDAHDVAEWAVALKVEALLDTRDAFDSVAPEYDQANTANPVLRAMRRRVIDAVRRYVARGSHVLDLGCGPGTDHRDLVAAGCHVTAIDWSPAMADEARRRARADGLGDRVIVRQMGIQQLWQLTPTEFDAACSNFGPLNCVPDLDDAARQIAARIRRGGWLVVSVIGRVCPWEIAIHAWRGDRRRIRARFEKDFVAVPLNGGTVWMRYYAPTEFARAFAGAGFARVSHRALGLFAPPPYLEGFATRHAGLTAGLHWLDDQFGGWPVLREGGDHFLMVLRKT